MVSVLSRLVGTLLCALAILGLAACGGSEGSGSATSSPTESERQEGSSTTAQSTSEHFTLDNWSLLDSDPDAYEGSSVEVVGRIFQNPERDSDGVYFQMWADPTESDYNTIVAFPDSALVLSNGDYVRVLGEVKGAYEGENAFGASLTAVTVLASSVEVVDATEAAPPALATFGEATFTQAGITLTVTKIEIARDETRVFLTVENESGYDFSFYSSSGRAVQAGQQFDSTYSSADYPEISSDVVTGASSSGVVVFPALEPSEPLKLLFEGSSDNIDAGGYGSLKWEFTWN